MASVSLEVVRLSKRFGARSAVEGLSFMARQGEVVGLLGPNGAGKTTTIRLLTAVLKPTSGEFSVAGVPFTRPAEMRRRVGVLPESAGYPGHQTGTDYLRYHARLLLAAISRRANMLGKMVASLSLWFAVFLVSVPYVWTLGHGVSVVGPALLFGFLVGRIARRAACGSRPSPDMTAANLDGSGSASGRRVNAVSRWPRRSPSVSTSRPVRPVEPKTVILMDSP
jgi:hypothetical protein